MDSAAYDENFYANQSTDSLASAMIVLPLVFDLIKPASVLDVGCGVGPWLKAAGDLGISDILGVDGDYVKPGSLLISRDAFRPLDVASRFDLGRKFDLAISLEVAEHVDAGAADTFVDNLVAHAPAILFSAAIPGQGGTHHVNEQWPDYWSAKFTARSYEQLDCIRWPIWNEQRICPWYRQNTYLYVSRELMALHERLRAARNSPQPIATVHPELFQLAVHGPIGLRRILRQAPRSLWQGAANFARRLGRR